MSVPLPDSRTTPTPWRTVLGVASHCSQLGTVFGRRRFIAELPATLVRDPQSVDGPTSVVVRIGGIAVGHLAPEDAALISRRPSTVQASEIVGRVTAQVRYDWDEHATLPSVDVRLRVV